MLKWGLKLDIFAIPNSLFFDPIEINCQCNHWKCSNGHHFFQCLCWIAKYISHLPFSGENGSLAISDGIFLCNTGLKESTNDTRGQNIWVFMLVNIKKDVGWSFIGTAISASLNRSNLTLLDQRFWIDFESCRFILSVDICQIPGKLKIKNPTVSTAPFKVGTYPNWKRFVD